MYLFFLCPTVDHGGNDYCFGVLLLVLPPDLSWVCVAVAFRSFDFFLAALLCLTPSGQLPWIRFYSILFLLQFLLLRCTILCFIIENFRACSIIIHFEKFTKIVLSSFPDHILQRFGSFCYVSLALIPPHSFLVLVLF